MKDFENEKVDYHFGTEVVLFKTLFNILYLKINISQ